jgi:hypothetical protein
MACHARTPETNHQGFAYRRCSNAQDGAGRQGREGRREQGGGQTQPVHHAERRYQDGQPGSGGQARALAGLKGYVTNLDATAQFVIDSYHRLFQIEKSFRMSKHDLQARPIYHHKRDSIEAHLTIVFAALAISRWIEDRTGWLLASEDLRRFQRRNAG